MKSYSYFFTRRQEKIMKMPMNNTTAINDSSAYSRELFCSSRFLVLYFFLSRRTSMPGQKKNRQKRRSSRRSRSTALTMLSRRPKGFLPRRMRTRGARCRNGFLKSPMIRCAISASSPTSHSGGKKTCRLSSSSSMPASILTAR